MFTRVSRSMYCMGGRGTEDPLACINMQGSLFFLVVVVCVKQICFDKFTSDSRAGYLQKSRLGLIWIAGPLESNCKYQQGQSLSVPTSSLLLPNT